MLDSSKTPQAFSIRAYVTALLEYVLNWLDSFPERRCHSGVLTFPQGGFLNRYDSLPTYATVFRCKLYYATNICIGVAKYCVYQTTVNTHKHDFSR